MSDTSNSASSAPSDRPGDSPSRARPVGDRVDVKGLIDQASRKVSVDALVKKGTKQIALLKKDVIEEMVNQAVRNIVSKYRALAAGVELPGESVAKESQEEFNELLTQYQEANKAKAELEATREGLSGELDELRKELDTQKAIADGRLSEEAERLMVVGFKDFEHELNRIAGKVWEKRRLMMDGDGAGEEAKAEWTQVETRLGEVLRRLITQHQELFFGSGGRFARDRQVALLEKRLEKMHAQLAAMENALKAVSNQKLFTNQQVQNLFRGLGILPEDKNAEKKKGMLKVLLAQNKQLRQDVKVYEAGQTAAAAPAPSSSDGGGGGSAA